jgi:peptide/nickel transport system substrate-binding protein
VRAVLLVALPVALLAACPKAPAPSRITVVTTVEPDVLQPLLSESGSAHEVMALFARDLVINDPAWAPVPDVAAAIPEPLVVDGKLVVTWTLREGAAWEDGSPLIADDFIFAWRVQSDPSQEGVVGRDDALRIESMLAAPDQRSFTVTWREPNPFYASPRVHRPLPSHVLARRLVDPNGRLRPLKDDPIARRPLSNGPFRLKEHVPGQHVLFVRNEHYAPRALVDEVLVTIAASTSSALTMIAAGAADVAFPSAGPSPVEARAFVDGRPELAMATSPGQVWTHVDLNLDDPWLADVRVRKALAHALPRDDIFRALSGDLYETAHTYLPPRHWGSASLAPLTFDADAARALLDEAGWTMPTDGRASDGVRRNARGERLSLELAAGSELKETSELLQLARKAWQDVGVEVNLDLRPFKVFFGEGARKRKLKHMSFYSWTLDGTSMGGALWRMDKIPTVANGYKGQNLPGWRNDEASALLVKADGTLDVQERRAMLRRVQELVREELPAIPMYFRPVVVVHRADVHGIAPTGTLTPLAWNAHRWSLTRARAAR